MILVMTGTYLYFTWNNQNELANKLLPMLILTIGFGMIGFTDEFKKLVLKNTEGLKPKYKMLGLLIISVIYVLYLIEGLKLGVKDGLKAKYENLLEYNMKREKYIHKMGYLSKINKHKLNYKKLSSTDKKIFMNGVSDAYNYLLNVTCKDFQDMKEGKQYQRTKNK